MIYLSKQVQMRGGTSVEHKSFTGAPREITVDTDINTIRVHDGRTIGGHPLAKANEVKSVFDTLNKDISDVYSYIDNKMEDVGTSHNHDKSYVKLNPSAPGVFRVKYSESYAGLCEDNGDDSNWIRTSMCGIIPYKSGSYSAIGTSSWRFSDGWFTNLNVTNTYTDGLILANGKSNKYSSVRFNSQGSNKRIEYDANNDQLYVAGTKSVSNGLSSMKASTFESTSYAIVGGNRLYIQSSDPGNVPVGSVWIKI